MEKYKNEKVNEVQSTSSVNQDYVNELKRNVSLDMDGMFKAKNQTEFNAFFIDLKVKMAMLSELMSDFKEYRSNYVGKWFKKSQPYFRFQIPNVDNIISNPTDPSKLPIYTGGLEAALKRLSEAKTKEERDEWLKLIEKWFVEAEKKYVRLREDRTAEIEDIRQKADKQIEAVKDNYLTNVEEEETDPERKLNLQIRDLIWNLDSVEKVKQLADLFKQKCSQRQLNELYCIIRDERHPLEKDVEEAAIELYKRMKQ